MFLYVSGIVLISFEREKERGEMTEGWRKLLRSFVISIFDGAIE
jgi:hypothetical protein